MGKPFGMTFFTKQASGVVSRFLWMYEYYSIVPNKRTVCLRGIPRFCWLYFCKLWPSIIQSVTSMFTLDKVHRRYTLHTHVSYRPSISIDEMAGNIKFCVANPVPCPLWKLSIPAEAAKVEKMAKARERATALWMSVASLFQKRLEAAVRGLTLSSVTFLILN